MSSQKLKNVLSVISGSLAEKKVSHALIGAMAFSFYGMPRFTADIDLLSSEQHRSIILEEMSRLGYNCFQVTESFAQFDSELGVYGKVDFMFVHTTEGLSILNRAVILKDDFMGCLPIVQPTDYAVLKLMAIANNKERAIHDMADLDALFRLVASGGMDPAFSRLDVDHLKEYANRFEVSGELESLLPLLKSKKDSEPGWTDRNEQNG